MFDMQDIEQPIQQEHTKEINKQSKCDTTRLEHNGDACALMCMVAAPVTIVGQAIALRSSWALWSIRERLIL